MLKPTLEIWSDDDHLMLLTSWGRAGLSYKEIAANIGIARNTLIRWRKQNVQLDNALNVSKDIAVAHVENALYRSALGFRYAVVTNKGDVVWVTKFEKPNVGAQVFYLKNRKPRLWSDRKEVHHQADINNNNIVVKWGGEIVEAADGD